MTSDLGLRERKKQRTRQAISDAAIQLFLARGYDAVSVADVAAAAEVSKPTLFKYFRSKDELILDRIDDHRAEPAQVVRGRSAGESPLDALHRHQLRLLADRDPVTGISDRPQVIAFQRLLYNTESLANALLAYSIEGVELLRDALVEACGPGPHRVTAGLVANQILITTRRLGLDNWAQVAGGRTTEDLYPEAVAAVNHAYALLRGGVGDYCG
ncbi:TetR family transcriptional regulator [Fodinicola feengrottensis]|uniref:TetR family transcriptional regulator n=2 Tax=Fodinicola feengrottensis TaxID=435914 RepID=A0ABN2HMI4_9ACTN